MLTPEFLHQLKLTFKGIAELYCCSNFLISNNFTLHAARKWIEGKVTIIKMKKSTILFDSLVHILIAAPNFIALFRIQYFVVCTSYPCSIVQLLNYTMYDVNREWHWQ